MLATMATAATALFLRVFFCCQCCSSKATTATKIKVVTTVAYDRIKWQQQKALFFNYVARVANVAADYVVMFVASMQNLLLCMIVGFFLRH
jgi:hypothetical protein